MRRWHTVVIDDSSGATLEGELLAPLVLPRKPDPDSPPEKIAELVRANFLNEYLPLEQGELYATEADVEFQIRDFQARRAAVAPRKPIIELQRDFGAAWRLVSEFAKTPPDILFLDVRFDLNMTPVAEVEAIVDELQKSGIAPGRLSILDVLERGGLYILGKLMRSVEAHRMPLVILYSQSPDVQAASRPFQYAYDSRFEVVAKELLRSSPGRRKQVFRRRIRDYLLDGTVQPQAVRRALSELGSEAAIRGDHEALLRAFHCDVGGDWVFGSLFVAETVAYLSRGPAQRPAVVAELERFIAPLVGKARVFVEFIESSPARLFSHNDEVTYARHPVWMGQASLRRVEGGFSISQDDLKRAIGVVRDELSRAVGELPSDVYASLVAAYEQNAGDSSEEPSSASSMKRFQTFVGSLGAYNATWQAMLDQCRMQTPAATIYAHLLARLGSQLELEDPGCTLNAFQRGDWDEKKQVELWLLSAPDALKPPLGQLLDAVLNGIRDHAEKKPPHLEVILSFVVRDEPPALEIVIRDNGVGFGSLRGYDPYGRKGGLSTALLATKDWFEVEIHADSVKARPAVRSAALDTSDTTTGTKFVIRVPALCGSRKSES